MHGRGNWLVSVYLVSQSCNKYLDILECEKKKKTLIQKNALAAVSTTDILEGENLILNTKETMFQDTPPQRRNMYPSVFRDNKISDDTNRRTRACFPPQETICHCTFPPPPPLSL